MQRIYEPSPFHLTASFSIVSPVAALLNPAADFPPTTTLADILPQ